MLQIHLDSGGHGEVASPTEVIEHPEFFKEHATVECSTADAFPATTEPVAISNGQATCGQLALLKEQFITHTSDSQCMGRVNSGIFDSCLSVCVFARSKTRSARRVHYIRQVNFFTALWLLSYSLNCTAEDWTECTQTHTETDRQK